VVRKKVRGRVRRVRELTWEEAIELSFKRLKPILDKLRKYDLSRSKPNRGNG